MSSSSRGPRRSSGIRLPLWAILALVGVGVLILALSSVWLFRTVRDLASVPNGILSDFNPSAPAANTNPLAPETIVGSSSSAPGEVSPDTIPAWTGTNRVNILLLGVDVRCDEEGPSHSDTIIVTSIDPVSKSAVMLSLPRDLWVEIPAHGVERINQAFFLGEVNEYPGGGPALAAETVESFLGINIDYYLAVNFQAVIDFVDLMGGVIVDAPEEISDPTYPDNCYGYDPFFIQPGRQKLDGATALKYARTRATFGSDIDRAGRQQQVIMAAREQAMQLDTLPQLLFRAPQLWQSFRANIDTNLDLDTTLQLANLLRGIPSENISNVVLDYNYVENNTTFDGQQVLVPYRDKVRQLRDELFSPAAAPTPVMEAVPTVITVENARVAVFNGTAEFGLASKTQEFLRRKGINVTEIGNADSASYVSSWIIDYGSHPGTVQQLTQYLKVPPLNVSVGADPEGDFDILVILGQGSIDSVTQ